ncbi:MAG: prephenate/arogenate dehydrogenase [Cyanobacteriota bacterium]|jgi:arogenate dehydrogenase (NADP+)
MAPLWHDRPVGLVGLGLIGGSLALDLRARGAEVRAWVHRPRTAERALERNLAQRVSTDPEVLEGCGLVVLALPLDQLLAPPPELVPALPAGAVVTDVGSVKGPVVAVWDQLWPRFVGGHPMAGTARAGVEAGEPGLFQGRPWVLTPTERTDPEALEAVRELAEAVGSQPLRCAAAAHDRAVALISHLPVVVSAALLAAAERGAMGEEGALARALASSGFADTTRVGGGNPQLGTLMCQGNREAVLTALAHYQRELEALTATVRAGDWRGLEERLRGCQAVRPEFL